ncbi:MAG TPA: OmpA family protein [Anaeromyxobacter sp.]|nr:OmpA family protein [Anaeromyxobacter sp.]
MRRVLASAALLFSLTACVTQGTFDKKAAEANKFRQSWEDEVAKRAVLEEKIKAMQAQLDTLVSDVASLRDKIRSDEGSLATKESELRAARDRLAELQALVDELSKSKKKLEAAKAELEKKSGEYEQLASALRSEIDAGRVELMELRGKTTVKMKDKILFASGSATIGQDGRAALRKVAEALRGLQRKTIRVEGHTDNVPTGTSGPFPSNWELSSARALAVVHFLQENGVDPTRLSSAGYGEFQPIASNETPEGKSLNRRIEIVLAPLEGAVPAPNAPAPQPTPAKDKM